MIRFHFIFLLLLFNNWLQSQPILDVQWDKTYQTSMSEKINDAVILPDGNLLLVGTSRPSKKKGKDGLLLLVNPIDGTILLKKTFGSIGNDVFNAAAISTEDGSFYIVGSTQKNKQLGKKTDAWLMQLSIWGETVEVLRDTSFGGTTEDSFEDIVWMRKAALIAGYQNKNNGRTWVMSVNNKGIQFNNQIGQGFSKNLIGLVKGKANHYWLCGNTKKNKESGEKDGDIWFTKLDEKGYELKSTTLGGKEWEQVHGINRSLNGNLLIAGESWWRDVDADSWMMEIDDNGEIVGQTKGVGDLQEKASAVLQTSTGVYWLANTISEEMDFPKRFTDHHLALRHDMEEEQPFLVERMSNLRDNFEVSQLLKTPFKTYLLTGNNITSKKGQSAIRLVCLKNGQYLAAKGLVALENTSPKLVDSNGDNILSPNETGSLQFNLKNIGDTPISGGMIEITATNLAAGLRFKYERMFVDFLAIGDQQLISLPLAASNTLATGVNEFNFRVIVKEKEVLQFSATVKTGPPKNDSKRIAKGVVMGWRKPDLTITGGDRNIPSNNSKYTIQVAVTSDKNLKTSDFKVRKNGVVLQDERNKPALTDPIQEKELVQYTFTYTVTDLIEGENKIYVELPDGSLDPIIINYQPEKPNLHILAIGPTYTDLKFTTKDARDFAVLASKQAGNGFFNEVFIDTLLTPSTTEKGNIEISFAKLARRAKNSDFKNHIKNNDYVMIFFSGHGTNRDGKFRLLPTKADTDFPDATMVDYKAMLERYIKNLGCKTIVFIDACLSGNAKDGNSAGNMAISRALIEANRSVKGVTTFTSCSADQSSYEDASWQNGAFTKALLEGINGQSIQLSNGEYLSVDTAKKDTNQGDKIITIGELAQFLQKRVPDLVSIKGVQQIPMVTTDELDKNLPLLIMN